MTDSAGVNQSPVWSPNGRFIYFVSDREGPADIYRIPAGGGRTSPERLTVGLGVQSLSLSSDGRHLAYNVYGPWGTSGPCRSAAGRWVSATQPR